MREPTKKDIKRLLDKYYELIAYMQSQCIDDIHEVRKYTYSILEDLKKGKTTLYSTLEAYIVKKYNQMFLALKNNIIDAYNAIGEHNKKLTESVYGDLGLSLVMANSLPKTKPFQVTNKIFNERNIYKRDTILSKRVTDIIKKGFEQGLSIQTVQKKLDVEFGFRDSKGGITSKSKELIKKGKFSHRNGHIYQTYRIARTETMRMASIRNYEIFEQVERDDKRLKLISVIDGRERWQSAIMHGQISNKQGHFKYPDGKYYILGEQPKQWLINDREASYVVFLDNPKTAEELEAQNRAEVKNLKDFYDNTKNVADSIRKSVPVGKISTNYLKELIDEDLRKNYVNIGKLSPSVQTLLGSKSCELKLSFDNLIKNQIKHPEIEFDLYKNVSKFINNYEKISTNNGNAVIEKVYNDNLFSLVIKTTRDKSENYLLSMYISNHNKK